MDRVTSVYDIDYDEVSRNLFNILGITGVRMYLAYERHAIDAFYDILSEEYPLIYELADNGENHDFRMQIKNHFVRLLRSTD